MNEYDMMMIAKGFFVVCFLVLCLFYFNRYFIKTCHLHGFSLILMERHHPLLAK